MKVLFPSFSPHYDGYAAFVPLPPSPPQISRCNQGEIYFEPILQNSSTMPYFIKILSYIIKLITIYIKSVNVNFKLC